MNPFAREERVLFTQFTPEECRERLEERKSSPLRPETWDGGETRPVSGRVSSRGFVLRKRTWHGNSLQTLAKGRFLPGPASTRLVVRLGPGRWATIPLAIMPLYFTVAVVRSFSIGEFPLNSSGLLVVALFVAMPVAFNFFGRWLARHEADFLLRFLCETLEAEEHKGALP